MTLNLPAAAPYTDGGEIRRRNSVYGKYSSNKDEHVCGGLHTKCHYVPSFGM